ncbi:MAG: hypothetical protein KXJ52_14160 [Sediminibacterium sp.]|nr:hypothetical protein [Sediminibacterium sp.]
MLAGRPSARTSGRADSTHSGWQAILNARLQECKNAVMMESVTACHKNILPDGLNDRRSECKNAILPE